MVKSEESVSADDRVNILLVDDRSDKLMALEIVLASLGQNLVLAHSGTEALRHLLQQEFALDCSRRQHAGNGWLRNCIPYSSEKQLGAHTDHLYQRHQLLGSPYVARIFAGRD